MVPPPAGGLASSSNYLLTTGDGIPMTGLTVTIEITEALVIPNNAVDFQLNVNTPLNSTRTWQQFVCGFDPVDGKIGCSVELFDGPSISNLGALPCHVSDVTTPSTFTLPTGSRYGVSLADDGGNITSATVTFSSPNNGPFAPQTIQVGAPAVPGPIYAVQLDMTGKSGGPTIALTRCRDDHLQRKQPTYGPVQSVGIMHIPMAPWRSPTVSMHHCRRSRARRSLRVSPSRLPPPPGGARPHRLDPPISGLPSIRATELRGRERRHLPVPCRGVRPGVDH